MFFENESAVDEVKVHISNGVEHAEEVTDIHHIHIPLHMQFNNLTVKAGDKTILQDVSGEFLPGELVAIMGPSGAGKSTLLNFLAGHAKGLELESGNIEINGQKANKTLRRRIGYVLQEDVFFSHLTVQQTLKFVGEIRLPDTLTKQQKYKVVGEVIDDLGLRKCVNTVMGGGIFVTGCSGGEKKRCSIATELITNPSMLMMDEPTSGLDSSTAFNLIQTLKKLAQTENRTIVLTIHQPSSHVFHMFDKLLLVADGKVAYSGKTADVLKFFEYLGNPCHINWNPADFIMEQLTMDSEFREKISEQFTEFKKINSKNDNDEQLESAKVVQNGPSMRVFATNGTVKNGIAVKESGDCDRKIGSVDSDDKIPRWPTGYRTQVSALSKRAFVQSRKDMLDTMGFIQILGIAIVSGLLWLDTSFDEESISDRQGVMFFILIYLTLNPMFMAIMTFPTERNAITKERGAGMYRLSAYYTAKSLSETPVLLIQPLMVYTISYWMTGLNRSPYFLVGMLAIATIAFLSQSFGLVIGGAIKHFKKSMTVTILFAMTSMLLGGFYTKRVPSWLHWARYASHISYAYNILLHIEFEHAEEVFRCASVSSFEVCKNNGTFITGHQILPTVTTIDLSIGESFAVLWGLIVFSRILFYLVLKYLNKPH